MPPIWSGGKDLEADNPRSCCGVFARWILNFTDTDCVWSPCLEAGQLSVSSQAGRKFQEGVRVLADQEGCCSVSSEKKKKNACFRKLAFLMVPPEAVPFKGDSPRPARFWKPLSIPWGACVPAKRAWKPWAILVPLPFNSSTLGQPGGPLRRLHILSDASPAGPPEIPPSECTGEKGQLQIFVRTRVSGPWLKLLGTFPPAVWKLCGSWFIGS